MVKYGKYLEDNMVPGWEKQYVSYERLKKILKVLKEKLLTKPPAEWDIGVSLSTPAPTNAAAMPTVPDDGSEDVVSLGTEDDALTQNDFFKVLEADMDKVQAFTRLQVRTIREALVSLDGVMSSYTAGAEMPIGAKEQVDAVGDRFLKLEKYVNVNFTAFR